MTMASLKCEVPLPPLPAWTFEPGILFSEMPTPLFLTRENYFALGLALLLLVLGASESACDFQATEFQNWSAPRPHRDLGWAAWIEVLSPAVWWYHDHHFLGERYCFSSTGTLSHSGQASFVPHWWPKLSSVTATTPLSPGLFKCLRQWSFRRSQRTESFFRKAVTDFTNDTCLLHPPPGLISLGFLFLGAHSWEYFKWCQNCSCSPVDNSSPDH